MAVRYRVKWDDSARIEEAVLLEDNRTRFDTEEKAKNCFLHYFPDAKFSPDWVTNVVPASCVRQKHVSIEDEYGTARALGTIDEIVPPF